MNPNPDFTNHDAIIFLTANRHKGTWATEVRLKTGRRVRTAGRLNASASSHSLLSIGLIAALRSISGQTIRKINSRFRERKTRLKIVSTDPTFVDALQALIANDADARSEKPLRAGKQFVRPLLRQTDRFDLIIELDSADKTYAFQALGNWIQEHVGNPRKLERLPAFLVPVAVSES